jgi:hypothetical protein
VGHEEGLLASRRGIFIPGAEGLITIAWSNLYLLNRIYIELFYELRKKRKSLLSVLERDNNHHGKLQ